MKEGGAAARAAYQTLSRRTATAGGVHTKPHTPAMSAHQSSLSTQFRTLFDNPVCTRGAQRRGRAQE
eukprot:3282963-Rhodomonas_salina.2